MSSDGTVVDDEAGSRFVLALAGREAEAAYRRDGDVLTITHTGVPRELEGQGVASRLIADVFGIVRERGERIVPACAFVRGYVEKHPEVRDLIAPRDA